jgi:hypothetical protein
MSLGFGSRASTVTTQTHRKRTKSIVGEIVQEMLIPTPCGVVATVNKQQRKRMRFGGRPLVDHFEHGRHSLDLFAAFPRIYSGARCWADPIQIATANLIDRAGDRTIQSQRGHRKGTGAFLGRLSSALEKPRTVS